MNSRPTRPQRTARPRPRPQRPADAHARMLARRRRVVRLLRTLAVAGLLVWFALWGFGRVGRPDDKPPKLRVAAEVRQPGDEADGVVDGTFLGGAQRRYYGEGPVPEKLDLIWKARIGSGWTDRKEDGAPVIWAGAGWTGQPTLVRQDGKLSLVINGYDHRLHRYDAATGDAIWEYAFDDVIKSTNTVFANPKPSGEADKLIVTAGSRRGFGTELGDKSIASYRAVAFGSGKELWRLPVPRTKNYSQDVDASGIFYDGALYEAVEPGYVYKLDPTATKPFGKFRQPVVLARSRLLWDASDVRKHGGEPGGSNLCIEASPAADGDRIYITTGSGHVYALSTDDLSVKWDFKVGSDFDGTPVVRSDGKLLVSMERQYVRHGGVYLLDPKKPAKDAVVWWFPTEDKGIAEWSGGVVGSVAVNDSYDADGTRPPLAAFDSVDGKLYVVSQDELSSGRGEGPHGESLPKPKLVATADIGGSISTPAFVDDFIVAAGYDKRVHVFRVDYKSKAKDTDEGVWLRSRDGHRWFTSVREVASFATEGPVEATPLVWKGRIYIASRDGWLYCLGDKRQTSVEMDTALPGGD